MNYRDVVKQTLKTPDDLLLHACMGLCGEAGEVIEVLKKQRFHKPDTNIDHIKEELGDLRWYLELACIALGTTIQELEQQNADKLLKRKGL